MPQRVAHHARAGVRVARGLLLDLLQLGQREGDGPLVRSSSFSRSARSGSDLGDDLALSLGEIRQEVSVEFWPRDTILLHDGGELGRLIDETRHRRKHLADNDRTCGRQA